MMTRERKNGHPPAAAGAPTPGVADPAAPVANGGATQPSEVSTMNFLADIILTDVLWVLVIVGWVLLVITGLEADKPLSGGLPGHAVLQDHHEESHWGMRDRIGEIGGWLVFLGTAASLPLVLWWIFAVHGR